MIIFWLIAIFLISIGAYAIIYQIKRQKEFNKYNDGKGWR